MLAKVEGEKKGEARRYLTTRLGLITFYRQKLKRQENGKNSYLYPLDRAIRLEPRQERTPWVKKRARELATRYTYREAASLLSVELGEEIKPLPNPPLGAKEGQGLKRRGRPKVASHL